jgi:hypothetical protein
MCFGGFHPAKNVEVPPTPVGGAPPPKGSEVSFSSIGKLPDFKLFFELPSGDGQLRFDCSTCHMRDNGNEIQVGVAFISPKESDLQRL